MLRKAERHKLHKAECGVLRDCEREDWYIEDEEVGWRAEPTGAATKCPTQWKCSAVLAERWRVGRDFRLRSLGD
jgi:hypothetical protein